MDGSVQPPKLGVPVVPVSPPALAITGGRAATSVPDAEGGFIGTLLDIVNPLQHIPLISNIYRAVTGDRISGPGHILGGLLFGGPLGFVGGMASAVFDQITSSDAPSATLPAEAKSAVTAYARSAESLAAPHSSSSMLVMKI